MSRKVALITGITGQDGAYLADLLLSQGYIVHGIKRRSSSLNTERIDHLYRDRHDADVRLFLHYGDMTDSANLMRLLGEIKPTEIYNLAAQSHVQVSFETPEYTANADALGTLRLLEAIRILGLQDGVRFYQASTSELLRQGAGDAAARDHAVLSAQPLRGGQALCLLDHRQLPRSLRHARLERHSVQPRNRRSAARPSSPARSPARWRRSSVAIRTGSISAISTPSATGAMPATMSRACGASCSRNSRRLRAGDRRDAHGARVRRARLRPDRPAHRMARRGRRANRAAASAPGGSWWRSMARIVGRPKSISCSATPPRR